MLKDAKHYIVHYDPGKWAALPANNCDDGPNWQWGDEILVGWPDLGYPVSTSVQTADL